MTDDPRPSGEEHPRVLMLGKGWFPDQLGGLDRYFRDLLEHRPEAHGLVVGPAADSSERVTAVSRHAAPLPWRLLVFAWAARRLARSADVIDAHFALYACLPLITRRLRRMALVVHFQGPWADENVAQGDGSGLRLFVRRALERIVYRRAARVVVLSSAFRRLLIERYAVSPWRVRVELPGVDLARFSPGDRVRARARFELEGFPFVAVCVRRLVPRMGLDVLIDAWIQALPELPPNSQLRLAGGGPLRAEVEGRITMAGLEGSVRLLGRLDDRDLVDLYRAADVGVVPTRSFEGFGLVVLEAAACGTPTIVTAAGGLPEVVAGLDPSLTVPPGDVPALASRLARAAGFGGLPSRSATREFAEGYSWERAVERNRAVCREALVARGCGAADSRRLSRPCGQLSGGEIALLRLLPYLRSVEPHVILAEDGPFAEDLVLAGISTEMLPDGRAGARSEERRRHAEHRSSRRGHRRLSLHPAIGPAPSALAPGHRAYEFAEGRRIWLDSGSHRRNTGRMACPRSHRAGLSAGARDEAVRWMTRRLTAAVIANSHTTMATLNLKVQPLVLYSVMPEPLSLPPVSGPTINARSASD